MRASQISSSGSAPQALTTASARGPRLALLEFPSAEAVKAFATDPKYAPYATARQAGSESRFQLIGDTDLAGTIPYLPKGRGTGGSRASVPAIFSLPPRGVASCAPRGFSMRLRAPARPRPRPAPFSFTLTDTSLIGAAAPKLACYSLRIALLPSPEGRVEIMCVRAQPPHVLS
jgi:Domain of unknown function (DUF1330)